VRLYIRQYCFIVAVNEHALFRTYRAKWFYDNLIKLDPIMFALHRYVLVPLVVHQLYAHWLERAPKAQVANAFQAASTRFATKDHLEPGVYALWIDGELYVGLSCEVGFRIFSNHLCATHRAAFPKKHFYHHISVSIDRTLPRNSYAVMIFRLAEDAAPAARLFPDAPKTAVQLAFEEAIWMSPTIDVEFLRTHQLSSMRAYHKVVVELGPQYDVITAAQGGWYGRNVSVGYEAGTCLTDPVVALEEMTTKARQLSQGLEVSATLTEMRILGIVIHVRPGFWTRWFAYSPSPKERFTVMVKMTLLPQFKKHYEAGTILWTWELFALSISVPARPEKPAFSIPVIDTTTEFKQIPQLVARVWWSLVGQDMVAGQGGALLAVAHPSEFNV